MPETWNVAVSKCGKEVSGMGGYESHVSGNDGNERKRREGIKPHWKRKIQKEGLRQCRKRGMLPRASPKDRYPAWQDT